VEAERLILSVSLRKDNAIVLPSNDNVGGTPKELHERLESLHVVLKLAREVTDRPGAPQTIKNAGTMEEVSNVGDIPSFDDLKGGAAT
jgi:hypothetical protein